MYWTEIIFPGSFLTGLSNTNEGKAREAETFPLLVQMVGFIADASVSLYLYEDAKGRQVTSEQRNRYMDRVRDATTVARHKVDVESGPNMETDPDKYGKALRLRDLETTKESHRVLRGWGLWPSSYLSRLPLFYARSFLFALDGVEDSLAALRDLPFTPASLTLVSDSWRAAFSQLRPIRNSAHHIVDRVQGKKPSGKIDFSSAVQSAPEIPLGIIVLDNLDSDDNYGFTMADGNFGTVAVDEPTLVQVASFVQKALDAFEWTGPAQVQPF